MPEVTLRIAKAIICIMVLTRCASAAELEDVSRYEAWNYGIVATNSLWSGSGRSPVFSPDGSRIAYIDTSIPSKNFIIIKSLPDLTKLKTFPTYGNVITWSPDSKRIASASAGVKTQIIDIETEEIFELPNAFWAEFTLEWIRPDLLFNGASTLNLTTLKEESNNFFNEEIKEPNYLSTHPRLWIDTASSRFVSKTRNYRRYVPVNATINKQSKDGKYLAGTKDGLWLFTLGPVAKADMAFFINEVTPDAGRRIEPHLDEGRRLSARVSVAIVNPLTKKIVGHENVIKAIGDIQKHQGKLIFITTVEAIPLRSGDVIHTLQNGDQGSRWTGEIMMVLGIPDNNFDPTVETRPTQPLNSETTEGTGFKPREVPEKPETVPKFAPVLRVEHEFKLQNASILPVSITFSSIGKSINLNRLSNVAVRLPIGIVLPATVTSKSGQYTQNFLISTNVNIINISDFKLPPAFVFKERLTQKEQNNISAPIEKISRFSKTRWSEEMELDEKGFAAFDFEKAQDKFLVQFDNGPVAEGYLTNYGIVLPGWNAGKKVRFKLHPDTAIDENTLTISYWKRRK